MEGELGVCKARLVRACWAEGQQEPGGGGENLQAAGVAGPLLRGSGHQERLERGSRAYHRCLMFFTGRVGAGAGADLSGSAEK